MTNLSAAGLSESEAKCYEALLTDKDWKPSDLAKTVNETRTNCYKILDKLVSLSLATRFDKDKKLHYRATNPARLIELARAARDERARAEQELEIQSQALISTYMKIHEQPGVHYYQGETQIGEIFSEIAKARDEVVSVHTLKSIDYFGFNAMHNLRMLTANAGVRRRSLTVDSELAPKDYLANDKLALLTRTWLGAKDYTAPVEWGAFDNKLYIISYGTEAMGIVLESPQIADGFKQLFAIMERGQLAQPDYNALPKLANSKGQSAPKL